MYNGYAITIPGRSPVYPSAPGRIQFAPSVAAPRTVPAPTCPRFKGRRAVLPLLASNLPIPAPFFPHSPFLLTCFFHRSSAHTNTRERERGERGKKVKEPLQIYFSPRRNSVQKRAERTVRFLFLLYFLCPSPVLLSFSFPLSFWFPVRPSICTSQNGYATLSVPESSLPLLSTHFYCCSWLLLAPLLVPCSSSPAASLCRFSQSFRYCGAIRFLD